MLLNVDYVGPHGITATYGGWFHVYSFAIMFGIFASILGSWVKFHRYRVPSDSLAWAIVFIIPSALFGASFLGKDDPNNPIPMPFWSKFAFWHGGMSIHGGVLFGIISGGIIFYIVGRYHNISLWIYGDCIVPNILLGQVLGRWGNFFNHELLGSVVSYDSLSWLPAFIRDNCFKLVDNGPEMSSDGHIIYRAPMFLYESVADLGLWAVITFMVPNLGKWFGKKPWKIEPDKYRFNFYQNFKYTTKIIFNPKYWSKKNRDAKHLTWTKMWNNVYYYHKVSEDVINESLSQIPDPKNSNSWFHNYKEKVKYHVTVSKKLYEVNNPQHYGIIYAGVQMGLYLFGWNIIRFILELQREPQDLFLMNRPTLDYTVILLIAFFGLVIAFFAQFVAAKFLRMPGWTYEKEY